MTCAFDGSEYNKYSGIQNLPYKIISHLIQNNEDIWKLIKYTTPDALDLPNLTTEEKGSLIWNGEVNSQDFRVFMQPATDDSFTEMMCQFRIYPLNIHPTNRIVGTVDIAIELYVSSKINQLNNYSTRASNLLQQLIGSLNGIDVDTLGKLYFSKQGSVYDESRTMIYNSKNTFGYILVLSVNMGNNTNESIM